MPLFYSFTFPISINNVFGWLFSTIVVYSSFSSASAQPASIKHLSSLQTLAETKFKFPQPPSGHATVIVFLSDECPLSQNYTLTLQNLYKQYNASGINFYAVFTGKYTEQKKIAAFIEKYSLTFPVLLDKHKKLARQLIASVTPEVFLLGNEYQLLYRGSIDDWATGLGKKRKEITRHYLKEAILATLTGQEIVTKTTKPIGCYIE